MIFTIGYVTGISFFGSSLQYVNLLESNDYHIVTAF